VVVTGLFTLLVVSRVSFNVSQFWYLETFTSQTSDIEMHKEHNIADVMGVSEVLLRIRKRLRCFGGKLGWKAPLQYQL